ncbi:Growth-regulating factor 7 [Bienertia sinuspersici]
MSVAVNFWDFPIFSNASITTTTTTCAPSDDNDNNNHNNGPPSLLSNNEGLVGRWCDGDRAIPLKKRRTMVVKCDIENDKEKQMLKSSVTTSDEARIINNNGDNNNNQVSGKKSNGSKRGNTIMEGSRCSRVNGRGWRCCQQTLVGYSLCEHHLGKGRLRSMTSSSTSAKSRSSKNKKNASTNTATYPFNTTGFPLGSHDQEKEKLGDGNNNVEKKMERMSSFGTSSTTTSNKRVKLGVVKARSLSSLLGQTNTMSNIVGDHHANMHQQEKISN